MSPTLFRPAFSRTRRWLAALLLGTGLTLAAQAVPAAPTGLRGVVTASGAFTLLWDDNSTDESGFEISYTANGTTQPPLTVNPSATGVTGLWGVGYSGVGAVSFTFTVRAYTGATPTPANRSPPTNTIALNTIAVNITDPAAVPTNPTATTLANGTVRVTWVDNLYTETGYLVEAATSEFGTYTPVGSTPANPFSLPLNGLAPATTYYFKVRGFQGTAPNQTFTGYSIKASTTTPAIMAAPTGLTVTATNETSLSFAYADNTANNTGYEIESRPTGGGTFTYLGEVGDVTSVNAANLFAPGTAYDFQVRAYYQNGASRVYSGYSNIASATTPFYAPTGLAVTATNETSLSFTYADNSAANTGYEIEVRFTGGGAFTYLGDVGDVATITAANVVLPGTGYDFQVRAYYQNGANPRVYAGYSNIASVATPFYAPTNFTVTPSATSPYLISFAWTDNSAVEDGYELEYRVQGAPFFSSRKVVVANTTGIASLPEFEAGTAYEFRLRARLGGGGSAYFPAAGGVAAVTRNGFSSKPYAPIQVGAAFAYQMATGSQVPRTSWSVDALPPGLTFDSATGVISGTPTTAGVYPVAMTANFASGPAHTLPLVLRILLPPAAPQIAAAISAQTLTQGGTGAIALDTKFADPDTEAAVRMATTKGNVDIVFYATTTPQTVANFLTYDYSNVIFHRAPANFVVQGGGFKSYAAPDVFEHVATPSMVPNEPGISNTFGTVAMAKVGDNPDSATSEFFFNLGNNSANLDSQNGGFTVFGRVAAPSLGSTLAALATAPVASYPVRLHTGPLPTDTVSSGFTDLPIDQYPLPVAVDQSRLVKITAVTALPVLTYAVTANSNPSVVGSAVAGTSLQLTGLAPGVASISVSATDVDGNVTPQTFTVTVQQTLAQWAAAQGTTPGAGDNPDYDALTNLQEWAFFGNPNVADTAAHLPTFTLTPGAGAKFVEITFPVRKFAANLTYTVEASGTLANDWTIIWTSAQGFAVPAVTAAADQPDRTIVTVRDTFSTGTAGRRFLRTKVQ